MFLLRRCVYFSISISVTLLLSTSSSSTYLSPAASTSSSSCHCHPSIPTSSSLLLYHLIHRFLFLLICLAFFLSAANSSVLSAHHSSRWRTGDFCLIQFHYIFFLHSILSSFILPFIPLFFISSLLNPWHSLFIRSFSSFHYIYIPSLFPSFLFFISLLRHLISFTKQILYSFHPFLRFILSSLIRFLTPFFSSFHSFSIPSFSLFLPFLHFVPPSFLCSNRCLVTYNYRPLTSSAESWYLFKLRQMSLLSRPIPRVGVAPAGRINLRCFHYLSLNGACVYLHDLITSDC